MPASPDHFSLAVGPLSLEVLYLPAEAPGAPTLVFLHEGLGSVGLWRQWPAQLAQSLGCAALVYSREGYGRSSPHLDVRAASRQEQGRHAGRWQPDYMHREALKVLPELLRAMRIDKPVLLGHSDGATIALLHAAHVPVAACIVMAPHVMVEELSLRAIEAANKAFVHGDLRARLAPFHEDVDGAFWQWNDVWLSDAFRSFDIRSEIGGIRAPLLAIQGHEDPYGSMAQIDEIARHVPQTRLLKLPNCGHSPQRDQTAAVGKAVAEFLRDAGLLP
jgi:pimeloyl-ACP methyl ester carboxylesterase